MGGLPPRCLKSRFHRCIFFWPQEAYILHPSKITNIATKTWCLEDFRFWGIFLVALMWHLWCPSCCDFASQNLHAEHQPAAVVRCSPVLRSLWLPAGAAAGSRVQKQDLSQTPVTLWELLKRSCLQTLSRTTLHRLQNQTRKKKIL